MALDDILVSVGADITDYIKGLERAANATKAFESNIQASSGVVDAHANAINKNRIGLNMAGKAHEDLSNSMDSSRKSTQELGVDLEAADRALEEYHEEVLLTGKAGLMFAGVLQTVATVFAAAVGGMILHASRFEDAFIGVQKTVSGTPEEFAKLSDEIRGLSKELPRSASEIAGVAEEAGRLGVKRDDIAKFSKTMIMMGDSSDLSASQAAQSMARFMNIMGTAEDDVERLGSAITHMGNNAATSESEILEMSRRLAGASQQIGLSESEVIALAASMSELGIRAEAGGTAMQKTLLTMNTSVMEGGKKLEAFAKTAGMTTDEFKEAFERDAKEAIIAFVAGLDEVSNSGGDVASVLRDVGLNNERTMDTLLRLSSSHEKLAGNMKLTEDAWDAGTALSEEAEKRYDSLSSTLKIMFNRVADVAMVLAIPLMDAFKTVLTIMEPFLYALEGLAEWFDGLSDGAKKTISMFLLFTPVVIGLLAVVIAINSAWTVYAAKVGLAAGASGIMAGVATGLVGALALLKKGLALITGPVGWVVIGLGALAGGLVYLFGWLRKTGEEEKEFAKETEELTSSVEGLNGEIEQSASAYSDQLTDMKASSRANKDLAEDVVALSKAENKSAEDKTLLNSKIAELNGNIEGLNLSYDENTDSLNLSSDALKKHLSYMEEEKKLIASQERLTEIAKERNRVELKLEEINKHREKLNELTEDHGKLSKDTKEKLAELGEEEDKLRDSHKDLGIQYEVVGEQMTDAQVKVTQAIADGVKNMTLSYDQLTDSQQELVDSMVGDYEKIKDSATDMFEKIPEEAEKSIDEMIEILEHNIEATAKWADNLDELAELGASHLVEHFREAGPENAAQLQAVLDGGADKIGELEGLLGEGAEKASEATLAGLDMEDDAIRLIAKIVRGMSSTFGEEVDSAGFSEYSKKAMEDAQKGLLGMEDPLAKTSKAIAADNVLNPFIGGLDIGTFKVHGEDIMQGTIDGIDGKRSALEKTIDLTSELMNSSFTKFNEINSPSRLYKRHGTDIIAGLVGGLEDSEKGLLGSLKGIFTSMSSESDKGMRGLEAVNKRGVDSVSKTLGRLPVTTSTTMTQMLGKLQTGGSNQTSYMKTLSSDLTRPFSGLTGSFSGIASNAMSGLRQGLINNTKGVMAQARSIASNVTSTIKGALGIKSPSRVLMAIGVDTVEGMTIGMSNKIRDVLSVSRELAQAAMPEMPKLGELDIAGFGGVARFETEVSSSFDRSGLSESLQDGDEKLVQAIDDLRRDMLNLRIEMSGRIVGEIVEPHVTDRQNRKIRRR